MRGETEPGLVALTVRICSFAALVGAVVAIMIFTGAHMLGSTPGFTQSAEKTNRTTYATAILGGESIEVALYRPPGCDGRRLLFVFHGYERDAVSYLKSARRIARETCMTVVAPRFDRERFPSWRYQRAGVKRGEGGIDMTSCIGPLVMELVDWARQHLGGPHAEYVLFGHSAGAQMLSRLAAYYPLLAPFRIVIANPSSHVTPFLTERVPYGFRAAGSPAQQKEMLRRYLARPITLYLGGDDVGEFRLLTNRAARRQGENRLERGRAVYKEAAQVAAQEGWPFNWRLVEARGVGHSGRGMLRAPEAAIAINQSSGLPSNERAPFRSNGLP